MKKIITFIILFVLLLSLCIPSLASEMEDVASETGTQSFTDTLADFITENADTLLGVLTLIGSFLIAFLYKTGLLPLVRSGLSALGDLLGKSQEMTERFTKETGEQIDRIESYIAPMTTALERGEEVLRAAESKLSALEEALAKSEGDRRKTAEVLRTETELFYELLASVNLPEAQKESMTESYYRLKRVLEAGE